MTFPGFDKVWAQVEEKLDKKRKKNYSDLASLWNCRKFDGWFGRALFY
jgi:hypothetical protein